MHYWKQKKQKNFRTWKEFKATTWLWDVLSGMVIIVENRIGDLSSNGERVREICADRVTWW